MSFKPISFLIIVLLMLSCGSTKQIASAPTKEAIQIEEQNTEVEVEKVENSTEIESTEITIEKEDLNKLEVEKTSIETDSTLYITHENFVVSHEIWNNLLQKHVTDQGNVNYKGFKSDRAKLYGYIESLQNNIPQDSWNRNKILVYWINAYNALTVDLIIRNHPLQSIKDIKSPWDQRLWKFGSKWYNLNDIEHQILRKMDEPRIHFAIVCASVSCPKLQNFAFNIQKLNEQLDIATKEFLNDSSKNNISENSIKLSKIFKWFGKDFKSNENSLIDFLNQYSNVTISDKAKKKLQRL